MSFETDLYTKLAATAGITSLLGTLSGGAPCIFPVQRPQKSQLPALRYLTVFDDSQTHLTGTSGLTRTSLQIDCYASTQLAAVNLAEAVRVGLIGAHNGRQTMGSTFVNCITLTGKSDEPATGLQDASDDSVFNRSLDFELWHSEAVSA